MNLGDWEDVKEGPPTAAGLVRQPSVYTLTLDEFQNTLGGVGKDFGSMNMDEFLRSILTSEESLSLAAASAVVAPMDPLRGEGTSGGGGGGGLQRQGSLTLPRTLSQKTVDEVWRGMSAAEVGAPAVGGLAEQRQQTLGKMTLEEFLSRAGIVREDANANEAAQFDERLYSELAGQVNNSSNNNNNSNGNTGLALGFSGRTAHQPSQPQQQLFPKQAASAMSYPIGEAANNGGLLQGVGLGMAGLGGGVVTVAAGAVGSPANQISNGDLSSLSPVPNVFYGGMRGSRGTGVEKVIERRHRRMIKNRESAARSRARKQAYTMELEAEIAKLKEQNEELRKKQAEMVEMQKNRALEVINQQHASKKRCLRRTQTGPW
ncbi:ABSCISIC ACID-INSENSITIVE 5-like protein 7 [Acorus calamus]|uniref:ABSCISIC ACID-INSENSITIVE 5-like protein 7 n=1 Tax=Acorus calamus TaxID=4465 RepID=A0AAV9E991_ACOCL|nr:ABSCISIC ACID-INSENSITIVE 5-like protein 7 [Acorus calamus]